MIRRPGGFKLAPAKAGAGATKCQVNAKPLSQSHLVRDSRYAFIRKYARGPKKSPVRDRAFFLQYANAYQAEAVSAASASMLTKVRLFGPLT